MAIFARRVIQKMVNELCETIKDNQIQKLVTNLNKPGIQSLHAEWELICLFGLSHHGEVLYEPKLKGRSNLDLLFRSRTNPKLEYVADITCVSQESLGSRKPIDFLLSEFERLIKPYDLDFTKFHFQIGHFEKGSNYKDRVIKLKIPGNKEITRVLSKEIANIAVLINRNKNIKQQFSVNQAGLELVLNYDPYSLFTGAGFCSDNILLSIHQNAIMNSLTRKAKQIKNSAYEGIKGIFLCDSGANIMHNNLQGNSYSPKDVINAFFQDHPEIGFVCTLQSSGHNEQEGNLISFNIVPTAYRITGNFYSNDPKNSFHPIPKELKELTCKLTTKLPQAESDGTNASRWLEAHPEKYGKSSIGGLTMTDNNVKLSVRALQELLSGNITQEYFMKAHGFLPDEFNIKVDNPFKKALNHGKMITNTKIEKISNKDDDWIVFTFGDPDPAISKINDPSKDN